MAFNNENVYGYIRVSTREQNEDRQLIVMNYFGVPSENIFVEKQSGKDFNRPTYIELVQKLKPNDTLVVKSIDRLGRNFYMFEEIRQYNLTVMGMQNYYRIATHINPDASKLNRAVMTVITNRLKGISREGRKLTPAKKSRYGKSAMLRYLADEPIYLIGYI